MAETPGPDDAPEPRTLDALTGLAALTDPGPAALGVPDRPDPNPGRYPGPREEDGPQDVPQTATPADPAAESKAGDAAGKPALPLAEQAAAGDRPRSAARPGQAGRYVKRPVEVEAIQWTGENLSEIWDTFGAADIYGPTPERNPGQLIITTLEGQMRASVGCWVLRGVAGELYPCRDDIFQATYFPAGEA